MAFKVKDFHGDKVGFGGLVFEGFDIDRFAGGGVGKESFVGTGLVFADNFLGGVENVLGGAVVLFEFDDGGTREIAFEIEDVGEIGAAPGIDGLPVVANDTDIAVLVDEEADDLVLDGVGVLVFVDEDVLEFGLPFGADVGMLL